MTEYQQLQFDIKSHKHRNLAVSTQSLITQTHTGRCTQTTKETIAELCPTVYDNNTTEHNTKQNVSRTHCITQLQRALQNCNWQPVVLII